MRKPKKQIEERRVRVGPFASDESYGMNGKFGVPCGTAVLTVIVSDGGGWDHVSVSLDHRCPTWEEMCYVKRMFFRGDEWVMQLHPPEADNISYHDYCLHMWRPQEQDIPMPPSWMVGPSKDDATVEASP